jgi:hypothetical protein
VGEGGALVYAKDGRAFAAVKSGTRAALYGLVELEGGALVAAGEGGVIVRSEDGRAWRAP